MKKYNSNGKLLITGEYVVLDGASSLAVPCEFGQSLSYIPDNSNIIKWISFNNDKEKWFSTSLKADNFSIVDTSSEKSSNWLINVLEKSFQISKRRIPGCTIKTYVDFPLEWGLGSSSTIINNIARLFNINPFKLHFACSNGSGYDIACAISESPIKFQLINSEPKFSSLTWSPKFSDELYFIHLNVKQNSNKEVDRFNKIKKNKTYIHQINELTDQIIYCDEIKEFEELITEHEKIIGDCINEKPIKNKYFHDYDGAIKSLGAWGGDFILATRNRKKYFEDKGLNTVLPFKKMVKNKLIEY